uniref:Uncharacterized protein n=1 Tax=Amphiprion ocellaris TaxID=80972 RepID=A0AAQ5YF33_AMPOC
METVKVIGKDQDGRLMITEFNYNNETYRAVHVLCPNIGGERKTFVKETNENKYKNDSSRTELINLMEQNNLIDIWRSLNPNKRQKYKSLNIHQN